MPSMSDLLRAESPLPPSSVADHPSSSTLDLFVRSLKEVTDDDGSITSDNGPDRACRSRQWRSSGSFCLSDQRKVSTKNIFRRISSFDHCTSSHHNDNSSLPWMHRSADSVCSGTTSSCDHSVSDLFDQGDESDEGLFLPPGAPSRHNSYRPQQHKQQQRIIESPSLSSDANKSISEGVERLTKIRLRLAQSPASSYTQRGQQEQYPNDAPKLPLRYASFKTSESGHSKSKKGSLQQQRGVRLNSSPTPSIPKEIETPSPRRRSVQGNEDNALSLSTVKLIPMPTEKACNEPRLTRAHSHQDGKSKRPPMTRHRSELLGSQQRLRSFSSTSFYRSQSLRSLARHTSNHGSWNSSFASHNIFPSFQHRRRARPPPRPTASSSTLGDMSSIVSGLTCDDWSSMSIGTTNTAGSASQKQAPQRAQMPFRRNSTACFRRQSKENLQEDHQRPRRVSSFCPSVDKTLLSWNDQDHQAPKRPVRSQSPGRRTTSDPLLWVQDATRQQDEFRREN